MAHAIGPRLEPLEPWRGPAFLVTGGCWVLAGVIGVLHARVDSVAGVHLGDLALLAGVVAMVATFGGLLALYPRLTDRAPRLALGGVVLGLLPAIGNGLILLVLVGGLTRPALVADLGRAGVGPGIAILWAVGVVAYPAGPALFGVAILRDSDLPRAIGYLLALPVAAWVIGGLLEVTGLGSALVGPLGSGGVLPGTVGGAFLVVGALLRSPTAAE